MFLQKNRLKLDLWPTRCRGPDQIFLTQKNNLGDDRVFKEVREI